MAMMMNDDTQILPPRGKQKRLYARSLTLREAAERLLESSQGEGAKLAPRIDDEDLWRPA